MVYRLTMKMGSKCILFTGFLLALMLFSCDSGKSTENKEQQAENTERRNERISARTLGLAYLEDNRLQEAEEQFLKLIEFDPNDPIGYANLGIVYMRMSEYNKAEEYLKKALELSPDDPDIRLNLAKVYDMTNQQEESIRELEKNVESSPEHVRSLYSLAETFQGSTDKSSIETWESYLRKVVEQVPANIVARLHFIEALTRNDKPDEALEHLEEVRSIAPEFPAEADQFYKMAVQELQNANTKEALTNIIIFHNYLKLTNPYQVDIQEIKGSTGPNVGTPVISFSESSTAYILEGESLLDIIKFTDATESSGLNVISATGKNRDDFYSHFAVGDLDHDGDQDIYISGYLMQNNFGRFENIAEQAGLQHSGRETSAIFTDYDNDGYLDLYVVKEGSNVLYRNVSEGTFRKITSVANIDDKAMAYKTLFFDSDHDGDLDLLIIGKEGNKLYRNNSDGSFSNITESTGISGYSSRDAAIGDFDDDGDIDLFLVNENSSNTLLTNVRQGKYQDITEESGLKDNAGSKSITTGDYNNDGFLDLFVVGSASGQHIFYMNQGDGTFEIDGRPEEVLNTLDGFTGNDALFFDFDNDGFLDLIVSGESSKSNNGVFLFHNEGNGVFSNGSHLLPDDLVGSDQIEVADYNEDGDLDIFISTKEGRLRLLRNDGANANHHLKIQLVGLRAGSGKNNYFGIGSRIEVRAGDLYQIKTVDQPNVHFGLGRREKADVVRILWTNGTSQNIFSPGSDQDLIEKQQLKGSCPFLYTWDGDQYVFVKDFMWRSALGMPLGIAAGEIAYGFPQASADYIKIPGEMLKPKDGKYSLQVTSELWETIYIDELKLLAVDHPEDFEIYVDEKFGPPPFPSLHIYQVEEEITPVKATDGSGNDLLPLIREKDDKYVSHFTRDKYQGITEMHDLILDPGNVQDKENLHLFLQGWIFPTDASINFAISQNDSVKSVPPFLQVINENGQWETVITNLWFPMGKDKTVIVDLSDKFLSNDRRVRIRTNLEIYWDHVFFSDIQNNGTIRSNYASLEKSDLHYRGFSELYRKNGRYGPHWFDYYKVSKAPKWRDLTGNYTRFGDVNELLTDSDNKYIIANAGDELSVDFNAEKLPEIPAGWKRDFLIYSVGWVKDGDLNTATGNTVDPLPFHGMSSYPYGENESYPSEKEYREYQKKYNTRWVGTEDFRSEIKLYSIKPDTP